MSMTKGRKARTFATDKQRVLSVLARDQVLKKAGFRPAFLVTYPAGLRLPPALEGNTGL
jgi:hypothetical protein